MKLLLDQNISRRILPKLVEIWPGSVQVALIGMECSSDRIIWEFARDNGFVIVTKDADFQELSLLNASPPKVIWLRLGNATNQEILEALVTNQAKLEDRIEQAGLDCIELHRQ